MPNFTLNIEIPTTGDLPLPEGANFFHFSWRGTDVQLLVGYIDLLKTVAPPGSPVVKPVKVVPEITHRFLLSMTGFALLKAQIDDIARSMQKSGVEFQLPAHSQ